MPRLTIVIVTYNSGDHIGPCLASLAANRPSVDHETLIVDNLSGDDTTDRVRLGWPEVRVIEAGGNVGFAAANNLGIRLTSG
jgi:GT2 family glycosyltransferase